MAPLTTQQPEGNGTDSYTTKLLTVKREVNAKRFVNDKDLLDAIIPSAAEQVVGGNYLC